MTSMMMMIQLMIQKDKKRKGGMGVGKCDSRQSFISSKEIIHRMMMSCESGSLSLSFMLLEHETLRQIILSKDEKKILKGEISPFSLRKEYRKTENQTRPDKNNMRQEKEGEDSTPKHPTRLHPPLLFSWDLL